MWKTFYFALQSLGMSFLSILKKQKCMHVYYQKYPGSQYWAGWNSQGGWSRLPPGPLCLPGAIGQSECLLAPGWASGRHCRSSSSHPSAGWPAVGPSLPALSAGVLGERSEEFQQLWYCMLKTLQPHKKHKWMFKLDFVFYVHIFLLKLNIPHNYLGDRWLSGNAVWLHIWTDLAATSDKQCCFFCVFFFAGQRRGRYTDGCVTHNSSTLPAQKSEGRGMGINLQSKLFRMTLSTWIRPNGSDVLIKKNNTYYRRPDFRAFNLSDTCGTIRTVYHLLRLRDARVCSIHLIHTAPFHNSTCLVTLNQAPFVHYFSNRVSMKDI